MGGENVAPALGKPCVTRFSPRGGTLLGPVPSRFSSCSLQADGSGAAVAAFCELVG